MALEGVDSCAKAQRLPSTALDRSCSTVSGESPGACDVDLTFVGERQKPPNPRLRVNFVAKNRIKTIDTLRKFNSSPLNNRQSPKRKRNSSSNHHFSGAMLIFGGVYQESLCEYVVST